MSRTSRLRYPSGVFHIISRCLERRPLLDGEAERRRYLNLLERTLARTDARLLAYCIMSTHVHLVVQAGHDPLYRLTKPLNSGYATWKNRHDGRIGPVFASRPRVVLVQTDAYLLELVRYVHLNPVRAGVVQRPEQSDWTSHRAYIGLSSRPPWLHCDIVFQQITGTPHQAAAFGAFVEAGLGEGRREDLTADGTSRAIRALRRSTGQGAQVSDAIVGSQEFINEVLAQMGKTPVDRGAVWLSGTSPSRTPGLRELVAATCEALKLDEQTFWTRPKAGPARVARQVITLLWVRHYRRRQSELVRYLNVGSAEASRWYSKALERLDTLEPLMGQVVRLLPDEEPLLARSAADHISVQVDLLKD